MSTAAAATYQYPLDSAWIFWFDKPGSKSTSQNWKDNLKRVAQITSLGQFWTLSNHAHLPSVLPNFCNYFLFRDGIFPDWEDKANSNGGKWVFELDRRPTEGLDTAWINIMAACVGESMPFQDQICGCTVSSRLGPCKISIWIKESQSPEVILAIGKSIRETCKLPAEVNLMFLSHSDCAAAGKSYASTSKFNI